MTFRHFLSTAVMAGLAGCGDARSPEITPPPPVPPSASIGDTVYHTSLQDMNAVVQPQVGDGAGAVMIGGAFRNGGYEAFSDAGDVLKIPHGSVGIEAARGTVIFGYVPNYGSQENVKRDILLASEWTQPGFHFGKHLDANNMRLYLQFRGGDLVLRDVFVEPSDYRAWSPGELIEWRLTWDVSRAPNVLRIWQDGCELPIDQSSIPASITAGQFADDLRVGGRRGGPIHADGTITELTVLTEAVPEPNPSCP